MAQDIADFGCDACKRGGHQWAEIVVTDGRIFSVEAISIDAAAIDRVHAIDDTLGEVYQDRLSIDLDPEGKNPASLRARALAAATAAAIKELIERREAEAGEKK